DHVLKSCFSLQAGIKITLWELKLRLEQFIRSNGQHVMDFGNQLTNYDKQKCKELWNKFEDATTRQTVLNGIDDEYNNRLLINPLQTGS
ncbi:hypothetical protein D915_011232, partial [Fasciola hepatica]